ncbi:MAG: YicC family protein [Gammaproteobacteria bacterium]|nr:MAG: YicC family protein [Gammaproteobacteria bacterium]
MTGFARAEARVSGGPGGVLTWELRSVNHRYLDLGLRLPEELRELEPQARERLRAALARGKVEAVLRWQPAPEAAAPVLQRPVAEGLARAAAEAAGLLGERAGPADPLALLAWPGVLAPPELDRQALAREALALLDQALAALGEARAREGAQLAALVDARARELLGRLPALRARLPQVLAAARERLRRRLAELLGEARELDPGRLEQEMAYLAQRLDVAEELDRLEAHAREVRRLLAEAQGPVGRRLDFLMQELHREANTLSAKSADLELTRAAVDLKVLIEQMREQVQNIE